MKGIILAGGTGSRLWPLTKAVNKHLLPVGKYPMIYHAIFKLREAGIHDLMIVTGRDDIGSLVNLLGSGRELGVDLTYRIQDYPGGIAHALALAEGFVQHDLMAVILGDNIFLDSILPHVLAFEKQGIGAKLLLKEVENPQRFGVAEIDGKQIISIEEKPQKPKSNYSVTGIYMYDNQVFGIIKTLVPSKRGELEITDVNNAYIKQNQLTYDFLQGWWTDAGTHESLSQANDLAKVLNYD